MEDSPATGRPATGEGSIFPWASALPSDLPRRTELTQAIGVHDCQEIAEPVSVSYIRSFPDLTLLTLAVSDQDIDPTGPPKALSAKRQANSGRQSDA